MGAVHHRRVDIRGMNIFYREAGRLDAPVLLLPHGYPCSSFEFRNFIPRLADRWRLLAPDFPGNGFSDTAPHFNHDFDGYASFLADFADSLGAETFALWLHDFGSQIGLRLAIAAPHRIKALIIQNGDIYADTLGPAYDGLKEYWDHPTPEKKAKLGEAISQDGFRQEFLNAVEGEIAERISPDLWQLHWSLTDEHRRRIYLDVIAGLRENRDWFSRYQAYLREHRPPTLILWGPKDGYMPAEAGRAYLRDLPDADLHMFEDGGHWLLETHLEEVLPPPRSILDKHLVTAGEHPRLEVVASHSH